MKTIFLNFVLLILLASGANGQQENDYLPNIENKKFVGNWIANVNGQTLKITLVNKARKYMPELKIYTDFIEGDFTLNKGSEVLINKQAKPTIIYGVADKKNLSLLNASFMDYENEQNGQLIFEINEKSNTLKLSLNNIQRDLIFNSPGSKKKQKKAFRIPKDIILRRI